MNRPTYFTLTTRHNAVEVEETYAVDRLPDPASSYRRVRYIALSSGTIEEAEQWGREIVDRYNRVLPPHLHRTFVSVQWVPPDFDPSLPEREYLHRWYMPGDSEPRYQADGGTTTSVREAHRFLFRSKTDAWYGNGGQYVSVDSLLEKARAEVAALLPLHRDPIAVALADLVTAARESVKARTVSCDLINAVAALDAAALHEPTPCVWPN